MTGTGKTEEEEFREIYNIRVIQSQQTVLFNVLITQTFFMQVLTKFRAVVDVKARYQKGQPVLVGTVAVETSDYI